MKTIKTIIPLFLTLLLVNCNNWLEVTPKTERTREQLFSTEQGFTDALIGTYIKLMDKNAYGKNLSYYLTDNMAGLYDVNPMTTESYLKIHDWTNQLVEGSINSTFSQLYKAISECNSILEMIDKKRDVFSTLSAFNQVKGEALGIRALCHFDILRLFGPVPTETTNKRILPYVTTFGSNLTEHSTYEEYVNKLKQDMSDAESLMQEDAINTTDWTIASDRVLRMNYFAIKALQARVYLWIGDKTNALRNAQAVIDATKSDNITPRFKLGTMSDFDGNNLLFGTEHIFAITKFDLNSSYDSDFKSNILYKGHTISTIQSDLYDYTGLDIREPEVGKWWSLQMDNSGGGFCVCQKYSNVGTIYYTQLPIFRLSEMYLIACECADLSTAQTYFDKYLASRNLASKTLTDANKENLILKEYLKEFYAEGQAFFTYKRMNSPQTDILWSSVTFTPSYILPIPKNELSYN